MDEVEVEVEVEEVAVVDQEEDHQEVSPTRTTARQCSDDDDAWGHDNDDDGR